MENLAKMADFLAQMLYKVFDLIWSFEVPGTNIQLIFPLFLTPAVEFLMAIILGSGSQQVNLEKQRQYAVKNKGRLSACEEKLKNKHNQQIRIKLIENKEIKKQNKVTNDV